MDNLRPPRTVEVKCSTPGCDWCFWVDSTDLRLPDGPFFCYEHCDEWTPWGEKAGAK